MRRTHKYGNASQVKCYADGGKVMRKGKKKPKAKPEDLGTGMASRAAQSILDARQRREKEAGL